MPNWALIKLQLIRATLGVRGVARLPVQTTFYSSPIKPNTELWLLQYRLVCLIFEWVVYFEVSFVLI